MGRNYKDEYKKFQDSPAQKKKRAALNRENHKRGTYGNGDGLDVSHTKNGIKLEKSSKNKGRKEKSRMVGSKRKKQKGGILSGPSHKHGGIAAVVAGKQPVELEGGEYIIKKSSVDKLGSKVLDEINKKGRIPTMANGGKIDPKKGTMKKAQELLGDSTDYTVKLLKEQGVSEDIINKFINKSKKAKKPIVKKELTQKQKDAGWTYGGQKTQRDGKTKDSKSATNKPVKPKVPFTDNSLGDTGPDKKIKISKKKYDFSKPGAREARKRERRRAGVQERLKKAKPIKEIKARKDKSGPLTKTSDFAKKVKGRDQITFKKTSPATAYEKKMRKEKKYGKRSKIRDLAQNVKNRLSKLKFENGGYVNPNSPYKPTSSIPARPPFRQGVRMMGHGGQVSTSNDKASAGDIYTVHTHSGYKAGE